MSDTSTAELDDFFETDAPVRMAGDPFAPSELNYVDTAQRDQARPSIFDKALGLKVSLNKIGNSKSIHKSLYSIDADKKFTSMSKRLLDSKELKQIGALFQEVRAFLYEQSLPSPLKSGVYLIPIARAEYVTVRLHEFDAKLKGHVATFKAEYPRLIEEASRNLRIAYNPADYPPVATIENEFSIDWQFVNFGVPGQLKSISRALFEHEQEKAQQKWVEAMGECKSILRQSMSELVNHMVDRLTGNAEGKCEHCEDGRIPTGSTVECEACNGFGELGVGSEDATPCDKCEGSGRKPETVECAVCNGHGVREIAGKPKVFRNSLIKNMTEFLDLFTDKNIAEDAELETLVGQARQLLDGVDPEQLRGAGDDKSVRERVTAGLIAIKQNLDQMVTDAPDRLITFED